ncbi:MAG: pimeloyl-CoA dehydrogenase large subunit, partial [Desulfuromonadales bacterium]|nr:pimeloyl-CoA dehydrogenase large subunit [Desulfuromonadales bacterium]NIS44224.1 pimeloyl-CoA dehydrogenase large subunit [Desulfuromonadales bacterium]
GWLVPEWPEKYGGSPLTPVQRYILTEELTRAYAPLLINQGVRMVGPVIYTFGTDEQKEKYLP